MSTEVKVPQLPESVADATLVNWHKKKGDRVERDENLVDIETDKVVLEVPAPASGVLAEIKVTDGTTVTGGQVIATIEAAEEKKEDKKEDKKEEKGEEEDEGESGKAAPSEDIAVRSTAPTTGDTSDESEDDGDSDSGKLSPSVRRMLDEHDLDAAKVKGTGRHGRITKADVQKHVDAGKSGADSDRGQRAAPTKAAPTQAPSGNREDKRVPMTRMRARIAERMVEVQTTAAMLTSFNEADMTAVVAMRKQYRDGFEKTHGVKLGFMSFFVKAVCESLKRFPVVNASVDGKDVVYHDYYDIGIAVSVPKGLVVPIIRDADQLSFAEVEQTIGSLAERGRDGSLTMDDLTGGTFTITNGGVFGSLVSTPILNMPQSAILGMHKIQERPVVVDGEIVIRPMMYLALTYDHRIIDGKDAVQFLVAVKEALEDPSRMMLGV
ncbi:MAG: 2-oxoglutarate dehydrogenase complex dihydrolipoyllysine-residue succinyltransferase [Gammaproteobacteria bacterium]